MIDVFWHEGMLKHDTGKGVFDSGMDPGFLDVLEKHPENSDRFRNMVSILKRGPISPFISWHTPSPALLPHLLSFHSPGTPSFLSLLYFIPYTSHNNTVSFTCWDNPHLSATPLCLFYKSLCFECYDAWEMKFLGELCEYVICVLTNYKLTYKIWHGIFKLTGYRKK